MMMLFKFPKYPNMQYFVYSKQLSTGWGKMLPSRPSGPVTQLLHKYPALNVGNYR